MGQLVSTGQITLTDVNDYIFQGTTAPLNPIKDVTVWIDTSVNPPIQKIWNGTSWVIVNNLKPATRNLLLNSANERGGATDRFIGIPIRDILLNHVGKELVVSFDLKCNENGKSIIVHPYQNAGISIENSMVINPMTTYQRFVLKTKVKDWGLVQGLVDGTLGFYNTIDGAGIFVKNIMIALGNSAVEWQPAPEDIETAISNAQNSANTANNLLADIANDNVLSPSEKQSTKKEWDIIVGEKPTVEWQASSLGVPYSDYTNAYNALSSYITPLLADLTTKSTIVGDTFRTNFKSYYNAKINLLKAVTDKLKSNTDNVQVGGRNFALDTKNKTLNLTANGSIAHSVSQDFKPNARNKYVTLSAYFEGSYVYATGGHYGIDARIVYSDGSSEWIGLTRGSAITESTAGTIVGARYSKTYKLKDLDVTAVDNLTMFIRGMSSVSKFIVKDYKLEFGNRATDYTPAPEDVKADIDNVQVGFRNIILNSERITLFANNTGTGASVLKTDESEPYNRATPDADKSVSLYSLPFTTVVGTEYVTGIYVRHGASTNQTIRIYEHNLYSTYQDFVIAPNVWTFVKTKPYISSNAVCIIILANISSDSIGKHLDYKKAITVKGNRLLDWSPAPEDIETAISNAQNSANTANNLLADIANDNVLSPSEKQSTKKEWDIIVGEKSVVESQANTLGVSTTSYVNAYNSLNSYITPLLANLTVNSAIVGSDFRVNFKNYYDSKITLLKAVTDKLKSNTDNIQIGGRNLLIGSDLKSQFTTTAFTVDGITYNTHSQGYSYYNSGIPNPTTSYHSYIDNTTFGFPVVVYNESNGTRQWKGSSKDVRAQINSYGDFVVSFDVYATGLGTKIFGGFYYTKKGDTVVGFHSGLFNIVVNKVNEWHRVYASCKLNDDVDFTKPIYLFFYGYGFTTNSILYVRKHKLELGNKATDWTPAPEDVDSAIATAQSSADTANSLLSEIANDNVLSPSEKQSTKKEWDIIVGEKSTVEAQATSLGVSASAYTTAYNNLNSYITPLLADLNVKSTIVGTTFRSNFKAYYDAKIALLKAVTDKLKSNTDNIQIGGRNLILGTKELVGANPTFKTTERYDGLLVAKSTNTGTGYLDTIVAESKVLNGKEFTLSFFAKADKQMDINCHFYNPNSNVNTVSSTGQARNNVDDGHSIVTILGDNTWRRYWVKFTSTTVITTKKSIIVGRNSDTVAKGSLWACGVKLEEGNKATEWTPAPEDIQLQIDVESAKVINLEHKTDFLTGTTIEGNAIATGTLLVGNSDGTNAGITGLGSTSDGVYLWGGGTYQQMIQGLAKKEQRRNGIDIWRHPNGQIGFEIGIKDGRLIFNGYHSDGYKLFELDPNRGLIAVSYTQESWTQTPLRKLNYTSFTFDEQTIASEINSAIIKNVEYTQFTAPGEMATIDTEYSYMITYTLLENYVGYDYDNGTNPTNSVYENLKGMKANSGDRNTNIPNGWYLPQVGQVHFETTFNSYPEPNYTFTVYVYYYTNGKITDTRVVTITK